jgi:hypothetical protein
MKQQFTTNVPLSQFKAIKALLSSIELSNYGIYNNWSTEISEIGFVKFTYAGLQHDTHHNELKEIFDKEWSELVQLSKERFSDVFNIVVSEKTQTITNQ